MEEEFSEEAEYRLRELDWCRDPECQELHSGQPDEGSKGLQMRLQDTEVGWWWCSAKAGSVAVVLGHLIKK